MSTLFLGAALAAFQPLPAAQDADHRCVAAFVAASEFKKPDQVAILADPELEERAIVHMLLVGARIRAMPAAGREASAAAFKAMVEEAKQSARASSDPAAVALQRLDRCRTTVDAALSAAATRLSIPAEKLPLAYLRCTGVYAMFHGVAYRPESAHGRYGARMGRLFSDLYAKHRFTDAMTDERKREIWQRDYQTVEAEGRASQAPDERQQCLLLSMTHRGD
jgi:hypothetical protein